VLRLCVERAAERCLPLQPLDSPSPDGSTLADPCFAGPLGYEADDLDVAYVDSRIPADFVVGYGLDLAERYRNLPFVCTLAHQAQPPLGE
jgi:hypothetical protein